MMLKKKIVIVVFLLWCFISQNPIAFAQKSSAKEYKFPDYSFEFVGNDRWENFNRKVFKFNLGLNKFAIRPVHILWSSIMPKYGMDRIKMATENIEYPIRLVSSLIQRDFESCKTETIRFFTNTIIGIGGLYDPAKSLLNIEPAVENMEQALASCKIKSGSYLVLPVINSTTWRGVLGKILDMALNPSSYIATPAMAIVKFGLLVNRTSFMQPLISLVESNFVDPYDIAKKMYGLEVYIRCKNLERIKLELDKSPIEVVKKDNDTSIAKVPAVEVKKAPVPFKEDKLVQTKVSSEIVIPDLLKGGTNIDEVLKDFSTEDFKLNADIHLEGYNPQNPVVDSMRTSLFDLPDVDESIWNELSLWNRSFSKKIKTSSVNFTEGKEDYRFRYILQKKKNSPVAIVYPSIGEGIMSSHSVLLAKLFYDKGYSVVIQGSHFQWSFVNSMPDGYKPGFPKKDAEILASLTSKILDKLQSKYECEFTEKVFIGTSFGALTSLFLGANEYENNTLGNTKIISICPPIELIYAMKQVDKNTQDWHNSSNDLKQKVAMTSAKVLKLYEMKDKIDENMEINSLPFSEEEGKLITGFVMHQKLSDLIFAIEKAPKNSKSSIYDLINRMDYQDYAEKYMLSNEDKNADDLAYETSLHSISGYLENSDNYKIYHSLTDYLTNKNQLKRLKQYSDKKLVLLDNGAHLGFLYRHEFIEDLKKSIDEVLNVENVDIIVPQLSFSK